MAERSEQFEDDAPTFLLNVPVLNIDELDLEVSDLRAHVALRAELANLVKINVGVDVYLNEVKLDIKGLEAQALLTIDLERVLGTLDRALQVIDKNPQILSEIAQDVHSEAESARQDTGKSGRDVEGTAQIEDALGRVDRATKQTDDGAERETGEGATRSPDDLQIEEEYTDDRGRVMERARDESGNVVEEVLDEEGTILGLNEEAEDQEAEDAGEVDATDAARRKAEELGVKLSEVSGTGSGGRVLVRDVEKAAR